MIVGIILIALWNPFSGYDNAGISLSAKNIPVCLQGEPFIADGEFPLEASEAGNAHEVSGMRWAAHKGCERFVIDFTDEDGNPASSPGDVRVEVIRELGIVAGATLPKGSKISAHQV